MTADYLVTVLPLQLLGLQAPVHDVSVRDQKSKTDNQQCCYAWFVFLFERIFTFHTIFYFTFVLTSVHLVSNRFPFEVF